MKNKALVMLFAVAVASLALGGGRAAADPDGNGGASGLTDPTLLALITNDDVFATADLSLLLSGPGSPATQHYGGYPSTSPDSGTCGNDWAEDTFERHFTVRANPDGETFTVVQQFRQGSFVTNEGLSPGSCDFTDGSPPGTVNEGVTGNMHGYFIISNVGTQTSWSPYCDAIAGNNTDCTTTKFIDTHFTPCYFAGTGTCPVTTFAFHFAAGDQGLVEHEWKNASDDRGGNHGDIRSTNVP
jgi:hypothetical protein